MTDRKKNKKVKESKPVDQVVAKKHSSKLLVYSCVVLIAVVTCFVFYPSLQNDFTNWDDIVYVQKNPLVVADHVPVVQLFKTVVAQNYHPLTVLSLALNYQAGKLDPYGYHLVNLILHILNTILVFFFIFLLTRRNLLMAAIVALFFGIHPMHVESVAWVSERKDVLYVLFFMSGLITYLRYRNTKKMSWYLLTFLFFILSCLSKGMAVVFPVILLLIDYLQGVRWDRRLVIEKIPFFILSAVVGIIAVKAQQSGDDTFIALNTFTVFQRISFASYGALMYIIMLLVPYKLSALYPYPDSVSSQFYSLPFILLIIGALLYFFRKKEKEIVFGLLFYFTSVVLVLQFISVGFAIMADRYSYLSSIGIFFVVAYIINKAWNSKKGVLASMKYPFIVIVVIGAVTFSYQAYSRTQVWKNSETLWTDVIDNYPDCAIAYISRAEYYNYFTPDMGKALADYTKTIQLPFCSLISRREAYFNRAVLYSDYYHNNDLAITDYTNAINIDPYFAQSYNNRGTLYLNTGNITAAVDDFTKDIALNPTDADAYMKLAFLYFKQGKNDLALSNCNKAITLNPTSAPYYYNRALFYKAINQYEKATNDFTSGIQLNPPNVELYYNNIGICNDSLRNYDKAITCFSKAIELNSSVPEYWLNRSFAESKTGEGDNAKSDALKAQQLQGK